MLTDSTRDRGRVYDRMSVAMLLIMTVIGMSTWRDFGSAFDEGVHLIYGDHILEFMTSLGENREALTYRIDYLYGGGFDLSGAIFRATVTPLLDKWEAIHMFGMMVGLSGLWGTWRLGRALGGPRAGLLATAMIGATSVYWGHMAHNAKDLPFAAGYVWAMGYLVLSIRAFPRVPVGLAVKLAIAMGMAMSVRIGGILLVCYFAGAIGVWVGFHGLVRRSAEATYQLGRRLALTWVGIVAGAWVVMLVWWPWGMLDPVKRPLAALRRMSQFMSHNRKTPFAGERVKVFDIDWRYMPHYFGLKLPEFVVVLFVVGTLAGVVVLIIRARRVKAFTENLILGTLLFSLWAPWFYALYKDSVFYDGLRHFLFEVPVLVAGVAFFSDKLISWAIARYGHLGATISVSLVSVLCFDQYATMVRLHPHEYVYFNRFIGGVKGAVGQYDTDYYASTIPDAGRQFANQLFKNEPKAFLNGEYTIGGCGGPERIMSELPPNFTFRSGKRLPLDFHIGFTRQLCHLRHKTSPVYYELTRDDAMLVRVRDTRKKVVSRKWAEAQERKLAAEKKNRKKKKNKSKNKNNGPPKKSGDRGKKPTAGAEGASDANVRPGLDGARPGEIGGKQ